VALGNETGLSHFQHVTVSEVTKLIRSSANKSCELDPQPTFFVKQELTALALGITSIMNKSLESGKEAIVRKASHESSQIPTRTTALQQFYVPFTGFQFSKKISSRRWS
jgi:hypothetical protein